MVLGLGDGLHLSLRLGLSSLISETANEVHDSVIVIWIRVASNNLCTYRSKCTLAHVASDSLSMMEVRYLHLLAGRHTTREGTTLYIMMCLMRSSCLHGVILGDICHLIVSEQLGIKADHMAVVLLGHSCVIAVHASSSHLIYP